MSFAILPFVANAAYDAGMRLPVLLLIRFSLAALILWLVILIRRTRLPRARTALACLALGGIGYATQSALYFSALDYIAPSLATLLLYTFPVLVFVVALASRRERATPRRLGALVLALVGVAAVLLGNVGGALDPLGVVLGLGSALAYATYILIGDSLDPDLDRIVLTALVCTGATVTYGVVTVAAGGPLLNVEPAAYWAAGTLALVSTVVAVGTFFAGMRLVGASTASIVSCVEPVATVLIGVGLYGDRLTAVQLLGGLGVVTAVIVLQLKVSESTRTRRLPTRPG